MTSFLHNNSTVPGLAAGSPVNSQKYDHVARRSELTEKSLLQDLTFVGTIIDANQQLQSYKIRVGGMPDMLAVRLDGFGKGTSIGTKASMLYGVGTKVLAMTTPGLGVNNAVILGALPDHLGQAIFYGSPEMVASSPVGALKDNVSDQGLHNCAFNNFNGGHPVDTYAGDTTILNKFGCGLFVGAIQTSLVSGLDCSVELHYVDDLLRLNSYNFEHNTAAAETLAYADAGDYTEVKRLNPYVVESLGAEGQYSPVPKKVGTPRGQGDSSTPTGEYDLQSETQQGWFRYTDFSGYLSNIKSSYVTAPLTPKLRSFEDKAQDEVGLFREHVDSTGAYTVVSAKSLSFIKDCFIPVPKEQYRPDDVRGDIVDEISTYRDLNTPNLADFSVQGLEDGPAHASLLYTATSSDQAAFKTHRALTHFRERPFDWTLKEIDEIDLAGFKTHVASKGFMAAADGVSSSRIFAKLPKIGKLKINAREEVKYYASRSMIMMHDDGSIHIQDGYGASISLRAGGIDISCPGDITLRPGRNLVSLAGDTTSIISGVDVELAANVGDVRIQADRNVSVLGGNDGKGGILLETKAQATNLLAADGGRFKNPTTNGNAYGGIWMKAPESSICAVGKEAYVGNSGSDCQVYMDSGRSNLNFNGASCIFGAETSLFVTNTENPQAGTNLVISASGFGLQTRGGMLLESSFFMASGRNRDIRYIVNGGASFTRQVVARSFGGVSTDIGKVQDDDMQTYVKTVQDAVFTQSEAITEYIGAFTDINDLIARSVVGKPTTSLTNLTFCYPDSSLRGIPDNAEYVLFESDWQGQYLAQGAGKPMIFKGVNPKKPAGATAPGVSKTNSYFWPGAEALNAKYGKFEFNGRYVDDKLRFKKDGFDTPISAAPSAKSFEGNYVIVSTNAIKTKD